MESSLPTGERRRIIESFNATGTTYPQDKLIHAVFENQVRRSPAAAAVLYEQHRLTYSELNRRANRLAHYLRTLGIEVGEYVPILMSRCLQMLIAQLAVLKCGGAYVPMDPTQPLERQVYMIRDCQARWVLAELGRPPALEGDPVQWFDCTAAAHLIESFPDEDLQLLFDSPLPAYLMYTSGSTGTPKGVIVPHRAVNRLVINNGYARIERGDCIAHCSNPAFDASTFEIWGALLNGASVVIVPHSIVLAAERFAELLKLQKVTVLWLTSGLFTQYAQPLSEVFAQLRYLLVGGDVVNPETVRQVLRLNPPYHLLNGYGPTECTTFSTTYLIDTLAEDARSIPIGRPIANTQIYVLDELLQPMPIGTTGEIYIGGAGVAVGYLNRPELTAQRFIADPFSQMPQARLYRSGDLGRWRHDGILEYVNRNDSQVKIRGFRIELGEIEARLLRDPRIAEAVVVVRQEVNGEKQLVAYLVADRAHHSDPLSDSDTNASLRHPLIPQLRSHLRETLPEYMIPSRWVLLGQLPLTPNGKVDRRALPEPEGRPEDAGEYVAPRTELERVLLDIWEHVLKVDCLGTADNFFDLGGHSLHAMNLIARTAEQCAVELSFIDVLQHPTVEKMAALVESQRSNPEGPSSTGSVEYEQGVI